MSEKFTPGPWKVVREGETIISIDGKNETILCVGIYKSGGFCGNIQERNANSLLIAYAPELYETLSDIIDTLNQDVEVGHTTINRAEELLRNVRGE